MGNCSKTLLLSSVLANALSVHPKQIEYLYILRKTTGSLLEENKKKNGGNASGITSSKSERKERETKRSVPSYTHPETAYKGAYLQAQ